MTKAHKWYFCFRMCQKEGLKEGFCFPSWSQTRSEWKGVLKTSAHLAGLSQFFQSFCVFIVLLVMVAAYSLDNMWSFTDTGLDAVAFLFPVVTEPWLIPAPHWLLVGERRLSASLKSEISLLHSFNSWPLLSCMLHILHFCPAAFRVPCFSN